MKTKGRKIQVSSYWRSPNHVRAHIRDGYKVKKYFRDVNYVKAHKRTLSELPDLNALLTTGVPLQHNVQIDFTPKAQQTILSSVGILAGSAVLAVLLAKR